MATYVQIQEFIKKKYAYSAKSCWIADVKNQFGLIKRVAHNRISSERKYPCPENKKNHVIDALRYFKMIN